MTELSKLQRTRIAEVLVDKQILSGEYLNFSNRISTIQQEVLLTVKAERSEDIKDFAIDAFNSLTGHRDDSISKIRVRGTDENGNESIIDTSFMNQVEFVTTKLDNDTGESLSDDLLKGIRRIAKSF